MRRQTTDGVDVVLWHSGAITGRLGSRLPGVPIARPRTDAQARAALDFGWRFMSWVSVYDADELGDLYEKTKHPNRRERGPVKLAWQTYQTDRDGRPVVRVARLPRMLWPGLVVWHERGRYEVLPHVAGSSDTFGAPIAAFDTQQSLFDYLRSTMPTKD